METHRCDAGWNLSIRTRWQHRRWIACNDEQVARAHPCSDVSHPADCMVVPIEHEVAERCEVCYPPDSDAAAAAQLADEVAAPVYRLPYADN